MENKSVKALIAFDRKSVQISDKSGVEVVPFK